MIKIFKISIMGLLLTGCSSYSPSFDCKANHGVGCKSVSRVNQMIDSGEVPNDSAVKTNKSIKKQTIKAKHKLPFPQVITNNPSVYNIYRKPEAVLTIWVAPYIDQKGSYNEAQYIHEVVETGTWLKEQG